MEIYNGDFGWEQACLISSQSDIKENYNFKDRELGIFIIPLIVKVQHLMQDICRYAVSGNIALYSMVFKQGIRQYNLDSLETHKNVWYRNHINKYEKG